MKLASKQNDIRSTANTWKHILKLANGYSSVYLAQPSNSDQMLDDPLNWLTICIDTLCQLISTNLQRCADAVSKRKCYGFNLAQKPKKLLSAEIFLLFFSLQNNKKSRWHVWNWPHFTKISCKVFQIFTKMMISVVNNLSYKCAKWSSTACE